MASLLSGLKTQAMAMLPQLVQTAEPQIESQLRQTLRTIKTTKPKESQLFLTNWKKLDKAVQEELAVVPAEPVAPAVGGKRRKRGGKTQRVKKHKKRT
jgi:hypothetical protein